MNNNTGQQVIDYIKKAGRVLIALPQNPNGDAVGSGLALFDFLRKLDKEAEIVCDAAALEALQFLPHIKHIKSQLLTSQSFVISVSMAKAKLDELSYEVRDNNVDIFLKPKTGKFLPDDISFRQARFPYDLLITVDTPALDHLGKVYMQNTDLFFETTVINIDHHPSNENYGEINLVDLTATSTAEILATLIEDFEASLIDEGMATNLLTGIIVETNSFQHVKTTPRAFLRASRLVSAGGKQQDIIRELYKTKHIALLKLWGRALARLREVTELGLVYSLLSYSDMEKSGSSFSDIRGVMQELRSSLGGKRVIMLLAEAEQKRVVGYFALHPSIKAQVVASVLAGEMLNGSLGQFESRGKGVLEAEAEVLAKLQRIKEQLAA